MVSGRRAQAGSTPRVVDDEALAGEIVVAAPDAGDAGQIGRRGRAADVGVERQLQIEAAAFDEDATRRA